MSEPAPPAPSPALRELHVWQDMAFRSAAENMALDEALLGWTLASGAAAIRLYHWDHPACTFGYFDRSGHRDDFTAPGPVRRFTGGGLVEHGEDLTFALTLPAPGDLARADTARRYRTIHEALAHALIDAGVSTSPVQPDLGASPGPCFQNPVPWDLIDPISGRKLAGGAQRRSRGAVLHQGSVRLPAGLRAPDAPWVPGFLLRLAESVPPLDGSLRDRLLVESRDLVATRYGHAAWNAGIREIG